MKSFILSQKCFLKHILLLLVFLAYGVSSHAYNVYWENQGIIDVNGVKYQLYYKSVTYDYWFDADKYYLAFVEAFTGSSSEVVIPETVTNGGRTYKVKGLRYCPAPQSLTETLFSTSVTTIRFQGAIELNPKAGSPTFNCPNLQYIYFEGQSPVLSGAYGDYFQSPAAKKITVFLSDKTQEEIAAMTQNAAVWCDFKNVVRMGDATTPVKRNVNLAISHAKVEIGNATYVSDASTQVNMYSDLTLKVYQGYDTYHVESVKLNGMEILDGMTFTQGAADYLSYYTYTLPNITSDAYITVNGENSKYEVYAICSSGGTLDSPNSVAHPIDPNTKTAIRWLKADGNSSLTITPDAGYTLDNVYRNSEKVTDDVTQNNNGTYTYPLTGDGFISVVFKSAGENILFADPNVKAICIQNWDTNHDDELSKAEAAAVTTLGTVFKENADITSFDEFQYFTGVTSIGEMAFYNCTSLKSIILPPTITAIQRFGLCSCSSLEQIILPESLQTINQNAFNSSGLKTIFIPKNVNYILDGITGNCQNLVSIVVDSDNGKYDSRNGCNAILYNDDSDENNEEVVLLAGCKTTRIPEGVTKISSSCFYYQKTLTSIEIPSTVTQLGNRAFFCCSGLSQVVSKALVPPTIETETFDGIGTSCTLTVPYGTRDAYISAGWTETVFKGGVIEAAPEPGDILKAVIVPADGQYIKVFTDEDDDNYLAYGNETFTCEMQKGGTYKIGVGYKSVSENNLYINGVKQTEFVDNGDGYLTYTVTNVTEDMLIEAKYADTEWNIPICATLGGITSVYYQKTDGKDYSLAYNPGETTIFELREVEPGKDVRFLLEPKEGYELLMVYCGWERLIGADEEKEVKPLENGSYEFTLPAYQITTGKTTPVIIYKKIGEDVNFDINGDGKIDIGDVTKLVNEVLKQ